MTTTETRTIDRQVWLVTGAGRGMGISLARAALEAGHAVVATGRDPEKVRHALGESPDLLIKRLDITSDSEARATVEAAITRFGRIDVLVNNAAAFQAGFFEELTLEQIEAQIRTNLFGPMTVTRAVLAVMRRQRAGHIVSISSAAGLVGGDHNVTYTASKFGLEGWMASLHYDVAPFGIHTTTVNPGFFRTALLEPKSTSWPALSIDNYAERNEVHRQFWTDMNGKQGGDPAKLGRALVTIAALSEPPLRFVAGADAVGAAEGKVAELRQQIDAHRALSTSLGIDE